MADHPFIAHNVRNNMKKILALIPLTFLIFSCAKTVQNTAPQKKEPVEIRVSEDFVQFRIGGPADRQAKPRIGICMNNMLMYAWTHAIIIYSKSCWNAL